MTSTKLYFALVLSVLLQTSIAQQTDYTQKQLSDSVSVAFKVINRDQIEFQLTCQTQHWCAIGFGDSFVNCDVVRITKLNNKTVIVEDMYSRSRTDVPLLDPVQNVVGSQGFTQGTQIVGRFTRSLQTIDNTDAILLLGEENYVVWAVGGSDNTNLSAATRGRGKIMLMPSDYVCHYRCFACNGPLASQCITCKQSGTFNNNGYCQQENDISDLPIKVSILGDDFQLWYDFSDDQSIIFKLRINRLGYVGIGFGSTRTNTDLIMFQVKEETNPDFQSFVVHKRLVITDMYSLGNEVPLPDTALGGSEDIELLGYDLGANQNGPLTVKFRRKLSTGDPLDFVIDRQVVDMNYVFSQDGEWQLTYENTIYGQFSIDLTQTAQPVTNDLFDGMIVQCHVVFMFGGWGILVDFALFFVRYMKSYEKYLRAHSIIFVVLNVITVVSVSFMLDRSYDRIRTLEGMSRISRFHAINGCMLLGMIIVQHFLGLIVKVNLESVRGNESVITLKKYHQFLGSIIYLLAKANVMAGAIKYWNNFGTIPPSVMARTGEAFKRTIGFAMYYIFLFVVFIIAEIMYRTQTSFLQGKRIGLKYQDLREKEERDALVAALNSGASKYEVMAQYRHINFCLFEDGVYDISNLSHPGGLYIIDQVRGRDIGKYFYGGYTLEENEFDCHEHTNFALSYMRSKLIGYLNFKFACPFVDVADIEENKVQQVNNLPIEHYKYMLQNSKYPPVVWQISECEEINTGAAVYKKIFLESEHFLVQNHISGVQWLGRYFVVKPYGKMLKIPNRQYSVILCMTDVNIRFRQQVIGFVNRRVGNIVFSTAHAYGGQQSHSYTDDGTGGGGGGGSTEQDQADDERLISLRAPREPDVFSHHIPLLIKKMPASGEFGFSRYLHELNPNVFKVRGPYGNGLELNPLSSGPHVVFCGGTGLLPFVDLVDYLLRKDIHFLMQRVVKDAIACRIVNPFGEDYTQNSVAPDFRLNLYASFASIEDAAACGWSLCEHLTDITRYLSGVQGIAKQPSFLCALRVARERKWDAAYVKRALEQATGGPSGTPVTRVYICGPPLFTRQIWQYCLESQLVSQRQIYIL